MPDTEIAFIGLGIMGLPMAVNLVRAGYTVTGHNLTPERVDALVAEGGRRGGGVAGAVTGADVVITMVPDSPDVEELLLGPGGVYENAKPGTLVIDMSTIRPDVSRAVAEAGAERGLRVLDAPVSGGEAGAVEAKLSIMVGGAQADFEAARPIFDVLGTTPVLVGPNGAGQTVKAANQLIVAGNIQLLAEALVFLEAHGVDTESGLEVLGGGLAGSTVLQRKGRAMRERDFTPGFRIALHDKDMRIVTDSARAAGVAIPLGAQVAQSVAALKHQGHGGLDHSALLMIVQQLSGRS
ncbi:2-hydroxy-3-oxopropionate reductase [Nocardiopsis tropica]|jgi:2-hydroxy-3-oxopropionate reductase|uniref:2-hydroxy-3-oxopropionate reductase n=1 Tax=Nocardiopsis tropica TaxID=109330 RepID=A0ABU7KVH7_9ACTN|nr:2-hydroxy-3-oxopropionate reductase [Nocardiopsis umidischolae]MEE2053303.1 2-hydroxy-3-oxopropionate reductase [Nocardiopsis umidischolae]